MIRAGLFFLAALTCWAQPSISITGPATAKIGDTVTLSVNLTGSTGAGLSGVQFNVPVPAGLSAISGGVAIGPATTAAMKTLNCTAASWGDVAPICVVVGLNQTALSDGVLMTWTAKVLSAGPASLPVAGVIGTSGAGKAVIVAAAPPATVTVASPCDINGDGKTDISDILSYLNSYVFAAGATAACTAAAGTADLNGDGACNVIDLQRISNAAAPSGACVTGP